MHIQSNRFAAESAKLLRVRFVVQCYRGKAVKVDYFKHTFWLPLSWCRKIEEGDDGYTRITIPDWLLAKKIEEAKFEATRGMTRDASNRKAMRRRFDPNPRKYNFVD